MNLVEKYMQYVRPMKGSQIFHRWSFLTTVAAVMERRLWIDRGRLGIIFPNMYTILVGPPAAGKSTAASLSVDMISQVLVEAKPRIRLGPTKITQAALYKELKDAERLYPVRGVGDCRASPLFIYASELAINLSDFGGGTLTNELIDFYDSKGLTAEVQKRLAGDDKATTLVNPSITLLGCTTAQFLQSAAQDKLVTSGLSSRIMFVVEPGRVLKERNYIEPDHKTYQSIIAALIGIYQMSGPMSFDKDAFAWYVGAAEGADIAGSTLTSEFHQNYYGRKPDHVTKVAMVLAAMRGSYSISMSDVMQAAEWIELIEPDMIKAFGTRNVDNDPALFSYLLAQMPEPPLSCSEGDIRAKLAGSGQFASAAPIVEQTLTGMVMSGAISRENIGGSWIYQKNAQPNKTTSDK